MGLATQTIPATVSEAPYILDGLLLNEAGRKVREQYADTGGFTDHVFAVTALLGFRFIPRIRDLPSRRLYVFDPASIPKELKGLIGGKIREGIITANWPDILRSAATMVAGVMPPSQLLRKFALAIVLGPMADKGSLPPPARAGRSPQGNRAGGTDAVHHRMAARYRHAAPRPDWSQQG